MFCRLAAQELSLLAPRLSQENVRLVGIGLEELGVEEFVEKKFWAGGMIIYLLIALMNETILTCIWLFCFPLQSCT